MKYCKKCDNHYPLTKEHWHKRTRSKDGFETYCKSCVQKASLINWDNNRERYSEGVKQRKLLKSQKLNEYKNNCSCKKCGESRNHLLDFHHIDPTKKKFGVASGPHNHSWKDIKNEIKKCIVLCSNCHRDFHFLQKTTRISINKYVHS